MLTVTVPWALAGFIEALPDTEGTARTVQPLQAQLVHGRRTKLGVRVPVAPWLVDELHQVALGYRLVASYDNPGAVPAVNRLIERLERA